MSSKQASIFGGYIEIRRKSVKTEPKKPKDGDLEQKIKILYKMYEELYDKQGVSIIEAKDYIIKENIRIYPEDKQAEPIDLIELTIEDIDERINKMKVFMEKYDKIRVGT